MTFKKIALFLMLFLPVLPAVHAQSEAKINVTVIFASNDGKDFNIVNDAFRDELLKLFSYSNYEQIDDYSATLHKAKRETLELPEGYKLTLTLQGIEKERILVQAVIRKEGKQYMDTVVSILRPGVVFLGGPPAGKGVLIIVMETGF